MSYLNKNEATNDEQTKALFTLNEKYFIRTVTYHAVGRCVDVVEGFIFLDDAMWVADSGILSPALKDGFEKQPNSELEPIGSILHVNINSIVDFVVYSPEIVLAQK